MIYDIYNIVTIIVLEISTPYIKNQTTT